MTQPAVEKKRRDESNNEELGCAIGLGLLGYGTLGVLLISTLNGGDVVGTFLVTTAIVLCTAMISGAWAYVTKQKLNEVHRQRVMEENRRTEEKHQQLEERRMAHELEMAKLKALPSP